MIPDGVRLSAFGFGGAQPLTRCRLFPTLKGLLLSPVNDAGHAWRRPLQDSPSGGVSLSAQDRPRYSCLPRRRFDGGAMYRPFFGTARSQVGIPPALPGAAVDEFAQDVSVAQVVGAISDDEDQDLVQRDLAPFLGHHGTLPTASAGMASMVASLWAAAKWCSSMMSYRDSFAVTHISASGLASSSSYGR